ncbi:hypothetical protein CYMTET_28785, partial [Cymbomonas tetramitiformis]
EVPPERNSGGRVAPDSPPESSRGAGDRRSAAEAASGPPRSLRSGLFRQRLWTYLFRNMRRAIDEVYFMCEVEGDVEQVHLTVSILEESVVDFRRLVENVMEQHRFESEKGGETPTAIAWEVRCTDASAKHVAMLSSMREEGGESAEGRSKGGSSPTGGSPSGGHSPKGGLSPKEGSKSKDGVGGKSSNSRSPPVRSKPKVSGRSQVPQLKSQRALYRDRAVTALEVEVPGALQEDGSEAQTGGSPLHLFGDAEMSPQQEASLMACLENEDDTTTPEEMIPEEMTPWARGLPAFFLEDHGGMLESALPDSWEELAELEKELASELGYSEEEEEQGHSSHSWRDVLSGTEGEGGRSLHSKLMSPDRKKRSPGEMRRVVEEKQRRAEQQRLMIHHERKYRLARAEGDRQAVRTHVQHTREQLVNQSQEKQSRSQSLREQHIKNVARRASAENRKVQEVLFINELDAENRKLSIEQKL